MVVVAEGEPGVPETCGAAGGRAIFAGAAPPCAESLPPAATQPRMPHEITISAACNCVLFRAMKALLAGGKQQYIDGV